MNPSNSPATTRPKQGLNLLDAAMLIMGSMIGSGIFITSAQVAQDVHSPGLLLLAWGLAGLITLMGALSYGELAAAMPKAGGQYIYLKEAYNPLAGFLFGWTFFAVIQTGIIAAVAVAFANFTGILFPQISATHVLFALGPVSFGTDKLLAILCIVGLTVFNFKSVKNGAIVQNVFTITKIAALVFVIGLGVWAAFKGMGSVKNYQSAWPASFNLSSLGIFFAALVGALFSLDSWNNITYTAGEVLRPQRNLPLSLAIGTGAVALIYLLVNIMYVYILPFSAIAAAPNDRVGTVFMQAIIGAPGLYLMAILIMISTFGCLNGMILAGGRVYYAMALDKLFFSQAASLNRNQVPANSLAFQAGWACLLCLSGSYSDLLTYVIFAELLFYILTVGAVFVLRIKKPDLPRPYKAFGYPFIPALYLFLALATAAAMLVNKSRYSLIGLGIVLLGLPIFYLLQRKPIFAKPPK